MKKPVRILADPWLSLMALTYIIVVPGGAFGMAIWTYLDHDSTGVVLFFGVLGLLNGALAVMCMSQWFVFITFLPDVIRIKPVRKKATERPYRDYAYVYKARYWHGSPIGVGKYVNYIVISNRWIKDAQLNSINELPTSADVIKIKYSKKTYQQLMDTVPSKMAYKLKICRFE